MPGASTSPVAAWFDAPELADVLLRIHTQPHGLEPNTRSPSIARSYHCHAVVLSAQSGYFKQLLGTAQAPEGAARRPSLWRELLGLPPPPSAAPAPPAATQARPRAAGSAASDPVRPMRALDVHIEHEELEALHELLRMMYTQALPADAAPSSPLFLRCLSLAAEVEAARCKELLVERLAAVSGPELDYSVLNTVLQAEPGTWTSCPAGAALLDSCNRSLLRLFCDAPSVAQDEEQLQRFCSLPPPAVLAWVQSGELRVHSENCVVFLLSAWAQANPRTPAAELEQLAHQVRVSQLGPTFLHHILPALGWFKACSGMEQLPALLSCIRAGIRSKEGGAADMSRIHGAWPCPPQWMAPPRARSATPRTATCSLSLPQLEELEAAQPLPMPALYADGFLLQLMVQPGTTDPDPDLPLEQQALGRTLSIFFRLDAPAMQQRGLPLPPAALVPMTAIRVTLGRPGDARSKERSFLSQGAATLLTMPPPPGWHFMHVLGDQGPSNPSLLELAAPHLSEQQLHIRVEFTSVDTL